MKKSAKILTLAVALAAGFGSSTAQAADDLKIGADLVSSYVWRGIEYGNSAAVQPAVSYAIPGTSAVVGAWGSYALVADAGARYQELDPYITLSAGQFSLTVTDYYTQQDPDLPRTHTDATKTFDFKKGGPNSVETILTYSAGDLSLTGAMYVGGNTNENAKYCEASYGFYSKDKVTAKFTVGGGSRGYYGDLNDTSSSYNSIRLTNVGFTVTKDRYSVSYVLNPDTEKSHLIFMASF